MSLPNHRERQFMQYLRARGWINAGTLPSSPKTIKNLLKKGWIERRHGDPMDEVHYRITENGLAAKKASVPIAE
jgi:DNA-binding PadR family transcriptional regulator